MPDPIPSDDLYARLGVAPDADTPTIERAWRALLKRHHPDVAGLDSLEAAKRINVAHDWLCQPERRARYDAARRSKQNAVAGRARPRGGFPTTPTRSRPAPPAARPTQRDGLDERFGTAAAGIRDLLEQAPRLTRDDLDRLSVSAPIELAPDLRRFVPPDLWTRIAGLDDLLAARLPRAVTGNANALAAARSFGHSLVLELFLWLHCEDPEEVLELMQRGWQAAVSQPRYGPNGAEVAALIRRFEVATDTEAEALLQGWEQAGIQANPWPANVESDEYAALAISAALARRDAAAAPRLDHVRADRQTPIRDAFARSAHVTALRPLFSRREYAPLSAVWDGVARRNRPEPRPTATVRRA